MDAKPFVRASNKSKNRRLGLYALYLRKSDDGSILFSTGGDELYSLSKLDVLNLATLPDELLKDIDPAVKAERPDMLPKIKDLFEQHKTLLGDNGELRYNTRVAEHTVFRIKEQPGSVPPSRPPFRLSQPQLLELRTQLDKLLAAKLVEPSDSPYAAPVLFAPKKDGGLRMCIDYRALNRQTIKDKFPLPHPEDLFDELRGAKYFTKIDLLWGFWHIPIHPDDKHKSAFTTKWGLFQWCVLPFGLVNAPSAFSRMVSQILRPCHGFAVSFVDDILVYSATLEEHVTHVSKVLSLLAEHGLRTKPSKCQFFARETTFLGHVINEHG
eukprot:3933070-Rhodomonas_salina.1